MKTKTLMNGSLLAASIIAVVICVGMVTGFSVVKPFISVDPVSDKNVGDQFTINGTTSLPVGTMLLWQIMPDTGTPPTGTNKTASGIAGGNPVTKGDGTANRLSFAADMNLQAPGKWVVLVGVMKGDEFEMGDLTGSAYFTVKQGPASAGTGQYIRVDPVADKTTGNLLIVSGSTNLPAGTELMVQAGNSNGGTKVRAGTGGVNRFSSPIDTSGMEPGTKKITVNNMIGDLEKGDYRKGDVDATASFTLKGTYLTTDTPVKATITKDDFIRINTIGNRSFGDQFLITGTTSLPVGTEVLWQVSPASFTTDPDQQTGTFTGAMANSQVTKGTGNINRVSFAMDTYVLLPEQYNVSVSTIAGDLTKGDFRPGDLTGSVLFTVKQGPASMDTGQYIKIDPVADKTTGDLLIVTGSTNLPAGTILMVQTGSYGSDTIVHAGTGGVNQYSMPVDTSILKPGTLTITVTQMKGDPAKGDYEPGTVKGTASFTLKGTYLGVETPVQATITKDDYIRINAIGDRSVGDQFLITGMTSLPAGVGLIWEVMPYTGTIPTGLDMNAKGIMANNPVTKGDDTANRVSLAVDMNGFAPGKYVVLVGEFKGDPANRDIAMGDPVGSALFNLK